jgi:hypothetical protein
MKRSAYAQRLGVSDKTAWHIKRKIEIETIVRTPTGQDALVADDGQWEEVVEDTTR